MSSRREWIAGLLAAGVLPAADGPLRVLLVTGGHDHELSFYEMFLGHAEYKVNVYPHPGSFRGDLVGKYDVIVMYDMVEVTEERERENLRKYLEAGKGLVVLHHAIVGNEGWKWWREEVVGGQYFEKTSKYEHDVELRVRVVKKHPVTEGVGDFRIVDEAYRGMWRAEGLEMLLETDSAKNDRGIGWVGPWKTGRVVYLQLGHGREAHEHASYRRLVHQAIRWVGGR